jgi:1-deoxy-D-xylulose-5-phosphate reductoisomerase
MVRNLAILGSTGSIGKQALEVAYNLGIQITGLSANSNIDELERQIRAFHPKLACVTDARSAAELKLRLEHSDEGENPACEIFTGTHGLNAVAAMPEADMVLNSLVGSCGLLPTIAAIEAGKDIALANKETLVIAGEWVMSLAKRHNVKILPVDSEHSAVFQCLDTHNPPARIYLTASGGPFLGWTREQIERAAIQDALRHPNWSMGSKITIDSATMMNKGFEIIEAKWLFGLSLNQISVLVHKESIVHSMVEFEDGAVIAQLGPCDMRLPIQYALTYPKRLPSLAGYMNFFQKTLTFEAPDLDKFPCLALAIHAAERGGLAAAALNAANEEAVQMFLFNEISFTCIPRLIESVMNSYTDKHIGSVSDIIEADAWAREQAIRNSQSL